MSYLHWTKIFFWNTCPLATAKKKKISVQKSPVRWYVLPNNFPRIAIFAEILVQWMYLDTDLCKFLWQTDKQFFRNLLQRTENRLLWKAAQNKCTLWEPSFYCWFRPTFSTFLIFLVRWSLRVKVQYTEILQIIY